MTENNLPTRILVVDDNALLRQVTTKMLVDAGFQVSQAETGAAGLRLARAERPDLVLLDVGLPDVDGLEVCRRLKEDTETASIFVALISSTHINTLRQAGGLGIGADGYIARPISNQELIARIEALLRLKRVEDDLRRTNARLQVELIARQQSETQLRIVAENTYDWEFWLGPDETFRYCSPSCLRITGHAAAEFLARPNLLREIIHPDDQPAWDAHECAVAQTQQPGETEFRILHPDGGVRWLAHACISVFDEGGAPLGRRGSCRDVTRRRVAELQQAAVNQALRDSEAQFRTLAETAASAIFIYQGDTFSYANPAAEQLTGYTSQELAEIRFWEIVHPEDRDLVRTRGLARQRGEKLPPRYRFRIITKTGELRWVDFTAGLIHCKGQPAGLGTAFDVTELVQAQEAEQTQRILAEALRDTAAALASPLGFEPMLNRILEVVGRVMLHDAANVLLIEDGVARVAAHRGYEGRVDMALLADVRLPIATTANLKWMMETGRSYAIADAHADPAWVDAPGTHWVHSHAGAPICVHGQCIGFLSLDSATPGFFTEAKASHLKVFADQAGMALENAQLLDKTQRRTGELAALHEITAGLAGQTDLAALLDSIVEYARRLLRGENTHIYLYDPARGDLELAFTSIAGTPLGSRLALDEGLAGHVAATRQPQRIDDYRHWPNRSPKFDALNIGAMIQVPLLYGGELVGVLGVNAILPNPRRFTDDDMRLLGLLASHAAAAVRNAQLVQSLQVELAEYRRIEQLLHQSREMLRTVLDTIPQRVFWKDRNSVYLGSNAAYAEDGHLPDAAAIVGKTDFDLNWPDFAERFRSEDRQVMETDTPLVGFEDFVPEPGKPQRWMRTNKVPLHNPDGSVSGVLGTYEDITSQKLAEEKLKNTLAELERSNAELQNFAYIASHDLQEPLRMVASFVGLLANRYRGQLDSDADEFIGFAVDGAQRMQRLISDLLEYSRVSTRGQQLQPADATVALDGALWNLALAIDETGASVTHDPLPTVLADPTQLMQLFQNLIGNALKFHGNESPVVHVSARETFEVSQAPKVWGARVWEFSVRDNGIGIAPEYQARIFGIFQRLHTRDEYPGTGIGLAVCQKIVERHGGRIWVESQAGRGSTFHFTLPGGEIKD